MIKAVIVPIKMQNTNSLKKLYKNMNQKLELILG